MPNDAMNRRRETSAAGESVAMYQLPNGELIAHLNQSETDYMYAEIFEERAYVHPRFHIPDHACILDVGANIGMFSRFALATWNAPTVFAFEPIPQVFEILERNVRP